MHLRLNLQYCNRGSATAKPEECLSTMMAPACTTQLLGSCSNELIGSWDGLNGYRMPFKSPYYISITLIFLCGCTDSNTNELAHEQAPLNKAMSANGLSNQEVERVLIATIDGSDSSTRISVVLTLVEGGIGCDISGSVGYGIFVKPNETKEAVELLRNAPGLSQDRIEFVNLKGAAHDSD